jgi:tetratricopeptide (TPR) repeat protein
MLYKYMGRFTEAGPLYQRALAITENTLGPDHAEVATIYHNLGGLEHAAGNYARGEPFARRSVEIRRKALGPDHPAVAADLAALAALLDGQKKYAEAERLYQQALAIFERVYGPEHYEIAVNLNNLAALYQAQGKKQEAEKLYHRALAMKEKILGTDHPDTAMTLNNLAMFYKSQKKYDQAEPLFKEALSIFEKALGPDHPHVAICLDNYAQLLRNMKRTDEVRPLAARAKILRQGYKALTDEGIMVTGTINPQFACFALSVGPSSIHQWGVFAEERIPRERQVIEYTGERISRREIKRRLARSRQYLFRLNPYWSIDGAVGGSGAEYINHSCDPNLYSRQIDGHIWYISKRPIEPGEELTVDYRFSPDVEKVPCRCGSPKCRGTINLKADPAPGTRRAALPSGAGHQRKNPGRRSHRGGHDGQQPGRAVQIRRPL